jgi:glycosyltransferase involved in cell wall biosynthesis
MVDVRPPGPLGREALESMMFGTPVIVPEGSAGAEHAAAGNGGLWYRDHGELLDAVRALTFGPLRVKLAASGRRYATAHHGDVPGFVDRVHDLVLSSR